MENGQGQSFRSTMAGVLDLLMGFVSFFVGLRFLFRLAAANAAAPFVRWIYDGGFALMTPFHNIFADQSLGGGSVLDTSALMTLFFYGLLFYLVKAAVSSLTIGPMGLPKEVPEEGKKVIEHKHVVA